MTALVDIHCHMLPGIDDGADSWDESLSMAQLAVADGIGTVIVTPHQLGSHEQNDGDCIRQLTGELQHLLSLHDIPLRVLPGADVRIEPGLAEGVESGSVLTLGDHRRHILLELPHELYFPIEPVMAVLRAVGVVAILSHPERNQGLLREPQRIGPLVDHGCLMQITASSLVGVFGPECQQMAEWMLRERRTHFIATDAHGAKSRRPLLRRAMQRAAEIVGDEQAWRLCCHNPATVAQGCDLAFVDQPRDGDLQPKRRSGFARLLRWS